MTSPRQWGGNRFTTSAGRSERAAGPAHRTLEPGHGSHQNPSPRGRQRSRVANTRASGSTTGAGVRQFADHLEFLKVYQQDTDSAPELLDAVIVPTVRPASFLDDAAAMAAGSSRRLVVLCSRASRASDVRQRLGGAKIDVVAIDIPPGYWHEMLDFSTAAEVFMRLSPVTIPRDLSLKRNLGLLIARLAGWKKIVFMDDDMHGIEPGGLLRASAALDSNPLSCFLVEAGAGAHDRLPTEDNSAVCHALRLIGGKQNVFASGSALGVNISAELSFFPNIYNEDWFFMLRETERTAISRVGFVRQREYNPYIAERARYEEFGDVLAEGLLAHLHLGISRQPDVRYWHQFLEARLILLREIRAGLQKSDSQYAASATIAIKAAQRQLRLVTPDACVEYLKNFESDRRAWARRLAALPGPHDLAWALGHLRLH